MLNINIKTMILLAGGNDDPNLECLAQTAKKNKTEILDIRHDLFRSPSISWEIEQNSFNSSFAKKCLGAFVRFDVFSNLKNPSIKNNERTQGWFHAVQGFVFGHDHINIFNRNLKQVALFKPAVLLRAANLGLSIPDTIFSNVSGEVDKLDSNEWIAKPIAGGDYCYNLKDVINIKTDENMNFPMPAIVQKKLVSPEIRIYIIGDFSIAFEIESKSLDYRVLQDAKLSVTRKGVKEGKILRSFMDELGMDFGAADFKTDAKTGELRFLELNTCPMFSRFDEICKGKISEAMLRSLTRKM